MFTASSFGGGGDFPAVWLIIHVRIPQYNTLVTVFLHIIYNNIIFLKYMQHIVTLCVFVIQCLSRTLSKLAPNFVRKILVFPFFVLCPIIIED